MTSCQSPRHFLQLSDQQQGCLVSAVRVLDFSSPAVVPWRRKQTKPMEEQLGLFNEAEQENQPAQKEANTAFMCNAVEEIVISINWTKFEREAHNFNFGMY